MPDKPVSIITGDDVIELPYTQLVRQGLASGVTVDYVGEAGPDEWSSGPGAGIAAGRQGFVAFNDTFQSLFPRAALSDGESMMVYDAVLTSVSAIRLTSAQQPTPDAVASELGALHGARTVQGASGPLAFTADWSTPSEATRSAKPYPFCRSDSRATRSSSRWTGRKGSPRRSSDGARFAGR